MIELDNLNVSFKLLDNFVDFLINPFFLFTLSENNCHLGMS